MTFFEKNEEDLEALIYSLTQREKSTIVIGIYDYDNTCDKAIAYVTEQFTEQKTFLLDLFGQKIDSLLAFFRANLPQKKEDSLPIVHLKRLDPLLFTSENHKVVSSPLVAQINMERELLFHEVQALVVLWVTREGYNRLRMDAPDFMDWVVGSFVFDHDDTAQSHTLSFAIPKQTVEDRGKAAIHQLREKATQLQQRTHKFEQGTRLTVKDKKEYFNLLLTLVATYQDLYDLEDTKRTIEKAYDLAKANNLADGFEFGNLLLNWGNTETNLGNLSEALVLFEEALQHFESLEDKFNSSVCLKRIGSTHSSLGNLEKALGFFDEYNRLTKELYAAYPTNVEFKNGLAISYSKLGETHSSLGNLEKALGFFEEYNRLAKELYVAYPTNVEFKNNLAISYFKLGETHRSLGNLEKALGFFEKDIELTKELYAAYPTNVKFKNGLAISYYKLGEFSRDKQNDKKKAKAYFQQAEALWQALVSDAPQYAQFKEFLGIIQKVIKALD